MADITTRATVALWGKTVGYLVWSAERNLGLFEYEPEFVRSGIEIAPLTMPLATDEVYAFPGLPRATFKGLPSCLADSLPDDFGNAVINAWLARTGRDSKDFNPVERLLYTGQRGMGALEYLPALENPAGGSEPVAIKELTELAGQVLRHRENFAAHFDGSDDKAALNQLLQIGTSAGGARAKAVIALDEKTGEVRSGQVQAPAGFTYWLLKFDTTGDSLGDPLGYGRIEYAYHLMAMAAGVIMEPCKLLEEGGRAHFMTRRFDRTPEGDKLHVQTLCAMDHADYKVPGGYSYEEAFAVMREIGLSRSDQEQFFRRMVFNVLARNQDDHTKNIGFLLTPDGIWQLAPAYDVAWSYRPDSDWVATHQMTVNGKRDNFVRDDLIELATQQLPRLNTDKVIAEVADAVARWPDFAQEAGVPDDAVTRIQKTHRRLDADKEIK